MGRLIGTSTQYANLAGLNFQNAYTYDASSNRTSLTAPDGSVTTYGYDTLNRLNGLANTWAGSFGFGYDALSRRTSLTRPNGVNTNYSYDSVSHLLSVLHQAGSTVLDGASYTYDSAGNRLSKMNYLNGVTSNYSYDPLYALTPGLVYFFIAETTGAAWAHGFFYIDQNKPIPINVPGLCPSAIIGDVKPVKCGTSEPYVEPKDLEKFVQENRVLG